MDIMFSIEEKLKVISQSLVLFFLYEVLWYPLDNHQNLIGYIFDWKSNSVDFISCVLLTIISKELSGIIIKKYSCLSSNNILIRFFLLLIVLFITNIIISFVITIIESQVYCLLGQSWNFEDQIINTYGFAVFSTLIIISVSLFNHMDKLRRFYEQREKDLKVSNENKMLLLQSQVEPHFLFNSLSTAIGLIESNSQGSVLFLSKLATFYRKILLQKNTLFVNIKDELDTLENYLELMKFRHGECLILIVDSFIYKQNIHIPSGTLQLIAENIFKHNKLSCDFPIYLRISIKGELYVIEHDYRPITNEIESNGVGQKNIIDRYHTLGLNYTSFTHTENTYIIKLPVIYD